MKVLELDFYDKENAPATLYPFCYVLPLLPGRLADHLEYCRAAMHEKKEQTSQACRGFGMTHLSKWIQETEGKNYVLYYQETSSPQQERRTHFLSLSNDPKAQEATRSLREQTGVKFQELCPLVDCIYTLEL